MTPSTCCGFAEHRLSKFSRNVRLSVQHKCPLPSLRWYQMLVPEELPGCGTADQVSSPRIAGVLLDRQWTRHRDMTQLDVASHDAY